MPGGSEAGWFYASFWFLSLLFTTSADIVVSVRGQKASDFRIPPLSLAPIAAVVLVLSIALVFSVPVRARFWLSESEFAEFAQQLDLAEGESVRANREVGSYRVTEVSCREGFLVFSIAGAGGFDRGGGFLTAKSGGLSPDTVEFETLLVSQDLTAEWFSFSTTS